MAILPARIAPIRVPSSSSSICISYPALPTSCRRWTIAVASAPAIPSFANISQPAAQPACTAAFITIASSSFAAIIIVRSPIIAIGISSLCLGSVVSKDSLKEYFPLHPDMVRETYMQKMRAYCRQYQKCVTSWSHSRHLAMHDPSTSRLDHKLSAHDFPTIEVNIRMKRTCFCLTFLGGDLDLFEDRPSCRRRASELGRSEYIGMIDFSCKGHNSWVCVVCSRTLDLLLLASR
jgi:hypothetical protein